MASLVIAVLVTVEVDRPLPPCFRLRGDLVERLTAELQCAAGKLCMVGQTTKARVIEAAGES